MTDELKVALQTTCTKHIQQGGGELHQTVAASGGHFEHLQ